jgi:hypothetical protein
MSSWKKYGGTEQLESFNTITTKTLVADYLSLKNPYQGEFTISGDLIVNGRIYTIFDINTNTIVTKLSIGTPGLNTTYYLELSGNMYQSVGWIHQF